ncbi:MAG: molybdopterin-guanine dinucleotide biosynthesis protein B [gamma proteobacterium symbiont of Bathyaustriella thionipta]|nr:molybdopterin-guanine dinucleotide biosynthesis protein B [gamma proteobacterium symbiont of Bathyaustriella thionipta]MCU7949534.1 molybdopterin-guanine dinucleotide biosynthesis protein B [gamma proteobacterium symbiont of Bathyaustriella thionipta]MCU7954250.1 molybdopterin-guanine dinucleotide biosynthesis protein B [gamma proteobacterium symbiont of Bathyaustriella thionipta]MCU7956134.1 molybdopterin-guanine dinucleotide biosynthesis protein B [gamma proteobacterium symbiont of Bathyaus
MISLTTYHNIPLLGFAAFSGTGKTTLLEQLIPELNQANIRVAMVKHTHHDKFDIDKPGKDSYRLRKAGAEQMLVASAKRWALMVEQPSQDKFSEPHLFELLPHLDRQKTDLILVEGFKHEAISKIELHRPSLNKPLMYPEDPNIIAIASDHENIKDGYPDALHCPLLDINNISEITHFITGLLQDLKQNEPK